MRGLTSQVFSNARQTVNASAIGVIHSGQSIGAVGGEVNSVILAIAVGRVNRALESSDIAIGNIEDRGLCSRGAKKYDGDTNSEGNHNWVEFHRIRFSAF